MYKLYNFPPSGNCYKVRLLLNQLQLPFELIDVNIVSGDTHLPDFLQKNPNGKVPLLELEPDVLLTESNAILIYLAEGTDLLPSDRLVRTKVMQWLFFEQYSLGANLSRPRFWMKIAKQSEQFAQIIEYHHRLGTVALKVMEQHLEKHLFFVSDRYTIADIALFAYTHIADEGGFDLSIFPALQAWIKRIQTQPNYCPIAQS